MKGSTLALALAGGSLIACEAFAPSLGGKACASLAPKAALSARPLRTGVAPLRMGSLDDVDDGSRNSKGVDASGKQVMPSLEQMDTEFVDATGGFDGGDGQVGVVGDGSNAMDSFDSRDVGGADAFLSSISDKKAPSGNVADAIGGPGKVSGATKTGRVDKRFNAWGSDGPDITEELKAAGLVEYDKLTGEDIRKVERQQYNNWFQQRAVYAKEKAQREYMNEMAGDAEMRTTDDYKDFLMSGRASDELTDKDKENMIFATGARGIENKEALIKTDWKPCAAGSRIDGEFEMRGSSMLTIPIEPNSMVTEQFIARFTDDTDMSCFVVAKNGYDLGSEWVQGEIPRRGNSFELIVRHEPQGATYAAPKVATLVVDQEDGWKWTYKIIAST